MRMPMLVATLLAFVASGSILATTTASHAPGEPINIFNPLLGVYNINTRRTSKVTRSRSITAYKNNLVGMGTGMGKNANALDVIDRGGGGAVQKQATRSPPRKLLAAAYSACGLATTAAWATIVYTTIRSNQPVGAMMPTFQHGFFARIGALSAVPIIGSTFATLASSAAKAESWEDDLGTPSCRRENLALVVAGVGSALWTAYAPLLTKIPGTDPLLSHQAYKGAMRTGLIGCYASAAALGAAVWVRSLPSDVRKNPFSWPGRIVDGVCKSLVSLAPANRDDPVNVKYSLLYTSFLVFTGLQLLGSHPLSVIPSWTGRRLARAFPAWTILGAVASYNLKEAVESDTLEEYKTLSNGLRGFGTVYLAAKVGAVFLDPSWPESYHAVIMVPGWASAAILMVGLTLRSDKRREEAKEKGKGKYDSIRPDTDNNANEEDLSSSSSELTTSDIDVP